ncbi:MAG: SCO family protein [Hyphomicrobiaceae bacterium]|nr:SCO family protein [Hyphomicrobiaceae bacterium]
MKEIFTSLVALVLGASALWSATDGLRVVTTEGARRVAVREKPVAVPNVKLQMMSGTFEALLGVDQRVQLVEFIYTSCPTICQTAGSDLARLRDRLENDGYARKARILSISFDPQNDNVAQLRDYGERHGADRVIWTIGRPRQEDLDKILGAFGVTVIPDGYGGYQHNAAIHVLSPSGKLSAILDTDDIEGVLAEIARLQA